MGFPILVRCHLYIESGPWPPSERISLGSCSVDFHNFEATLSQWASSTGLTAVSKFKPRLPAQWAVGTHRIGPSRMEKVTSRINWPIRNSTQIRIRIELVGNTIMWNPSLFFISNRFYKTQNNFGPLNDHIITEFSWVVTMAPAVPSTDILRWPVTSQLPSTRRLKLWRICYIS